PMWNLLSRMLTLGVVTLALIFFRAQSFSDASTYLGRLLSWAHGTRLNSPYIVAAIVIVAAVHLIVSKDRNLALELPQATVSRRIISYAGLLMALVLFGASSPVWFIYFQF